MRHPKPLRVLALIAAVGACAAFWTWAGSSLAATPEEVRQLERVNTRVNRSIRYESDMAQYGQPERWVAYPPSGRGDCEDYAFTKEAELKRAGFASHRLRVRMDVLDERGGRHAVLVVDGEWVLDNRFTRVERIESLRRYGYSI